MDKKKRVFIYVSLIIFAILFLIPIGGTVITSLRTDKDILMRGFWALPKRPKIENFGVVWSTGKLGQYILNTLIITIPAVMLSIFIASLGAFALARYKFRGNMPIFILFISGMFIPPQVCLIPIYRLVNSLGIYDTYFGLIFVHTAFGIGICTFILRNFLKTIPFELEDAARIDGCSDFLIYWRIILPLSLPALAVLAILQFTWIWNDLLFALVVVVSDSVKPVMLGIMGYKGAYVLQWNMISAAAILASAPTLIIFLCFQKYFIRGIVLGAIK